METIKIQDLTVAFRTENGLLRAVQDVSLNVTQGEVFSLVGESGCGKSTLAYSLLNLVPEPGFIEKGIIKVKGNDVVRMSPAELTRVRGPEVSMVFQASMNSFNPVLKFNTQMNYLFEAHPNVWKNRREGQAYFRELLNMVRLSPDIVLNAYPHELSGGMRQRVAIAFSLLLKPPVLILDEPTTALDVLNQRLVLDVLRDLHRTLDLTVIFVTHDLGVVAEIADRVGVMYAGRMVDVGTLEQVFYDKYRHPYVSGLLNAAPSAFGVARAKSIPGVVPNLLKLPPGCRYSSRCPLVEERCRQTEPELVSLRNGHAVSCHVVAAAETDGTEAFSE